ncbi:GDSL-type esterase/lipase family protein [Thiorhodovibrio frisius]|uniref:GDSL-type esterase/lipase family protein n=1 Tax=Thiorhodovibrio frisius TaxID=631362 RepID=UPI001CBC3EA2|nr:GDSL-type esterase/lipase family protein [Thiorhodovibrio frisius]
MLTNLSGHRVINAGVSGEESDAGLERLPALLSTWQPDLVILGHGGNDFLRQRDTAKTEAKSCGHDHPGARARQCGRPAGHPAPGFVFAGASARCSCPQVRGWAKNALQPAGALVE